MAALFTTPNRNDKTSGAHFVEPDVCRRTLLAHGSWRRVTRRIVCGLACALTVSSLLMPSVSLAAEWVKVGGNKYNTAASDEAGTWSWDGADDLKLNNYNGGEIQAADDAARHAAPAAVRESYATANVGFGNMGSGGSVIAFGGREQGCHGCSRSHRAYTTRFSVSAGCCRR